MMLCISLVIMVFTLCFNVYFLILFIASEASFLVCSMARIFYMYNLFQAARRAVNFLNVSTCI